MRGKDEQRSDVFSYISPEQRVPHDHTLCPLRVMTDEALRELQPRFNKLYAKTGATVDRAGEVASAPAASKPCTRGQGSQAELRRESVGGELSRLIVNSEVFEANGTAERDAALMMLEQIPGTKQVTVGGDKAYDTADFVAECRNLQVTPHVAQNLERPGGSAIDARTTQHPGYAISQRKRKRIEECFGWLKTIALLRKVRHRGIFNVGWVFTFAAAAYNLVRMRNLEIQET